VSLTNKQKERLTRADEIIQAQATSLSKQPRFEPDASSGMTFSLMGTRWLKDMLEHAPPYNSISMERSRWLTRFWSQEPYLSGVINSVTQIDRNRGWSLVGGRNQVMRFSNVLHNWQVAPGKMGWRDGCGTASLSFWTTDIGALIEVGRQFEGGPMAGLFHLDPTRCKLTGQPDEPLLYNPTATGKVGKMSVPFLPSDLIRVNSMTNVDEQYNGLGYCALSRAIELAIVMTAVWRHEQEMLFARAPKGLLLLRGIQEQAWKNAMLANEADMDAKEREWFGNVAVFASGGTLDIDAKLFMLSNLPEGFDQEKFTNLLMFGYALCFGYDAREFWPVSGGALGTARETEVQHRKATDKGGREFWFGLQEQIQSNLPPTLHFEADERDAEGELVDANLSKVKADALTSLRAALPELSSDQILELAADMGLIPHDWVPTSDESEATDTEADDTTEQSRKRCLEWVEVQQAIERFPDEPIVQYHWPEERLQVLYPRGSEAVQKFYQAGEGVRPSSKQKRFEVKTIQGEMKKIADEIEQSGLKPIIAQPVEEQPHMGWFRRELQALREAMTNKPEPIQPVSLVINNQPPASVPVVTQPPGNVEIHNYLNEKSLDDLEDELSKRRKEEARKRQEVNDELARMMKESQDALTEKMTEFINANQKQMTSEVLADLKQSQNVMTSEVLKTLQANMAAQERLVATGKKIKAKTILGRLRELVNGK
jgi:hypothetical protein